MKLVARTAEDLLVSLSANELDLLREALRVATPSLRLEALVALVHADLPEATQRFGDHIEIRPDGRDVALRILAATGEPAYLNADAARAVADRIYRAAGIAG